MKYRPEWIDIPLSSVTPEINPASIEQYRDYNLQGMLEMGEAAVGMMFPVENVPSDEFAISDELAVTQGYVETPAQFGEGTSSEV